MTPFPICGVDGSDERNTLGMLTDSGRLATDVSARVTAPSDARESNKARGDGFRIACRRSGVEGVVDVLGVERAGREGVGAGGERLPRRSRS